MFKVGNVGKYVIFKILPWKAKRDLSHIGLYLAGMSALQLSQTIV
jgi:hypothetical protein